MSCFLHVNEEDASNKVNIDDLYDTKKRRDQKQLSIFNKILNRIHTRIRVTSRNKAGQQYIWFTVPEYIFGESLYEKGDCIAYLVVKLQENGFLVKYLHPNTLFVSWSNWVPHYVRSEFKKKTGKIMNEKGEISDPHQEDVVSEEDPNYGIFNQSNQSQSNKKEPKQYIGIDNYKPTGRFVYNPDILEKIEKKVNFH